SRHRGAGRADVHRADRGTPVRGCRAKRRLLVLRRPRLAANLWGHLLGATTDLTAGDLRCLSPLPLWIGILAGPFAWACDLGVRYALVKWTCVTQRPEMLHLVTLAALLAV